MTLLQPISQAREHCLQFLYQCEIHKIFYFSTPHFHRFIEENGLASSVTEKLEDLATGVLAQQKTIDDLLRQHSTKWSLERMPAMDRMVLRLATYELLATATPVKVVLNEAIELAKRYGTEHSSSFVNGVLDSIADKLKKHGTTTIQFPHTK
jgi:N utilization substance protein B